MSNSLGRIARTWCGSAYTADDHETKLRFHRIAMRRARKLAALIGLAPGTYDVRSNKAGMACSGEVTLHGESIYVQIGTCLGRPDVMVRSCRGRKDYTGGINHFVQGWDCLDPRDPSRRMSGPLGCIEALAAYCQAISKGGV